MNALKMHVEQIVRPVNANFGRKDQMREELFAHLSGIFEEELAARPDAGEAEEQDAAARAIARFGDPARLRAELQQSVPAFERMLFLQFDCPAAFRRHALVQPALDFLSQYHVKRAGESSFAHAARMTAYLAFVLAAFYAPLMALNALLRLAIGDGWEKWMHLATYAGAIAAALAFACFTLVLIGHGLHRALEDWFWGRRSWLGPAAYGALSSATVFFACILFWLIARRDVMPGANEFIALAAGSLAMPVILALTIRFGLAEFRRFGEWGKIEADKQAALR